MGEFRVEEAKETEEGEEEKQRKAKESLAVNLIETPSGQRRGPLFVGGGGSGESGRQSG